MNCSPQNIRAIAYDVRGHGFQRCWRWSIYHGTFRHDLISLLDRLVLTKAILCGLSMVGILPSARLNVILNELRDDSLRYKK